MAARVTKGILRRVDRLFELLVLIAGAGVASQFSGFVQHYVQNLAGRVAESRVDVDAIVNRARDADMPVYAYLHAFHTASNPVFQREGQALQAKIERAGDLTQAYDRLQAAGLFELPVVFLAHLDMTVAADTWRHFRPNVPVDMASLVYTVMGAVIALLAYWLMRGGLGLLLRLVMPRRSAAGASGSGG